MRQWHMKSAPNPPLCWTGIVGQYYKWTLSLHPLSDRTLFSILSVLSLILLLLTKLQIKGRWESNLNVWFRFMYSHLWNCASLLFQNRIIMFCLAISIFMYLWAIYIFPGSVCLFCCTKIGRPIPEYINHSQIHECRNWEQGHEHKSDFSVQCSAHSKSVGGAHVHFMEHVFFFFARMQSMFLRLFLCYPTLKKVFT